MSEIATIANLSVRYHGEDQWILDGVSLAQFRGKVTAIVGPSGCGKSTLIRTVCGLIPHSIPADYRGNVSLNGLEIAEAEVVDIATHIAYVGQNPDAAVVTRTVYDEVCFALQNLCLEPNEIDTRARKALVTVGLENYLWDDPWVLSGGLRQRLSLAAALAMKTELLVLDEPTATIDSEGRESFYSIIPPLVEQGMGVLVIDHDLDPLLPIVDDVIAIGGDGTVIASGPARDVFVDHAETLRDEGIWLPRALRAGSTCSGNGSHTAVDSIRVAKVSPALTCAEAGISLPRVSELCRDDRVTYYEKRHGVWEKVDGLSTPTDRATLDIDSFHVEGRSPAITARLGGGELVALIGPNGSGKSSLLSGLAGIIPSRFEKAIVGTRRLDRRLRAVGYVFQNPEHQFVESTVEKELSVGGTAPDRVEALLAQFHLTPHRHKHPLTLSGGQSRRLSVATMVSEHKNVVALDEPTYGQDWNNTHELMQFIAGLCASGRTVLMATHDLELAQQYATHIIALPLNGLDKRPRAAQPTRNRSWLGTLNPLTLFVGMIAPAMALFIAQNTIFNLVAMTVTSLLILTSRASLRRVFGSIAAIWIIAGLMMWVVSNAVNPGMYEGWREIGESSTAGTFVGALLGLVLLSGIATNPEAIIRVMTVTLHMPYRVGAAGTASLAFVSRFAVDFRLLRTARRLRGVGDRWGIAAPLYRWITSVVPLIITAVQHGERVALSMDSRGFGAYPRRTELEHDPWRIRDTFAVIVMWSTAVLVWRMY